MNIRLENNQIATKDQAIQAGKEMLLRSAPAQQENHRKVIAWIETLRADTIPSTFGGLTTYKCLVREWYAIFVEGKPEGTGSWLRTPSQVNPNN